MHRASPFRMASVFAGMGAPMRSKPSFSHRSVPSWISRTLLPDPFLKYRNLRIRGSVRYASSGSSVPKGSNFMQVYLKSIEEGKIKADPKQLSVAQKLDEMAQRLEKYSPPAPGAGKAGSAAKEKESTGGFLGWLSSKSVDTTPTPLKHSDFCRGMYLFGGCGTGKTMLMDMFFHSLPSNYRKKRVHFHEWMLDVHDRLHKEQRKAAQYEKCNTEWTASSARAQRESLKNSSGNGGQTDLVETVAEQLMDEGWLLCFDEFQVTFISDAILMKRLFSIMFDRGVVIVATSNRPPDDLYLNGLNRELFTPFIPLLKEKCEVFNIDSPVDYRLITNAENDEKSVYLTPLGDDTSKLLQARFYRLARNRTISHMCLEVQGRSIRVPRASESGEIAMFDFKDLCDKPLGAADYISLARAFHTIFVSNVPRLTMQERDQVRRFITMIDAFYEAGIKLVVSAYTDPFKLFDLTDEEKMSTHDEVFAWERTMSRLQEMQSTEYLATQIRELPPQSALNLFELEQLSSDSIAELWTRYDADNSGVLELNEVKTLLEDLTELCEGHRHVSDEVLLGSMNLMDTDENGVVDYDEFHTYCKKYGLRPIPGQQAGSKG